MDEVIELLRELREDMREMREDNKSYKQFIKTLQEENIEMRKEINDMKMKIERLEKVEGTIEKNEKRKRKNNILMNGLKVQGTEQEIKEKVENFIKENLKINCETEKITKIGDKTLLIKINSFEKKIEIMRNKSKLKKNKQARVYINNDLTQQERAVQNIINERAREERSNNKHVKVGYQNIVVNEEKFVWNKITKRLEKTKNLTVSKN